MRQRVAKHRCGRIRPEHERFAIESPDAEARRYLPANIEHGCLARTASKKREQVDRSIKRPENVVVDQGFATPEEVQHCLTLAKSLAHDRNDRSLANLLIDGRDLRPTMDLRSLLASVVQRQFGLEPELLARGVLPGAVPLPQGLWRAA